MSDYLSHLEQKSPNIAAPSGKNASTENFPVASILISAKNRPMIAAFYAFARMADDIADHPTITSEEKVRRLNLLEKTILTKIDQGGCEAALKLVWMGAGYNFNEQHALDLLAAFKQDATKTRYSDWGDLIAYCNLSAAPVGRFLLDIHGEQQENYQFSDALCNALQIINHLQDCRDDYEKLNRVYLPIDMRIKNGFSIKNLLNDQDGKAFRLLLDECLVKLNPLMDIASELPLSLKSKRLALESAVIVKLAKLLVSRLQYQDSRITPVKLSKIKAIIGSLEAITSFGIKLIIKIVKYNVAK